jgi:hypothetical protein
MKLTGIPGLVVTAGLAGLALSGCASSTNASRVCKLESCEAGLSIDVRGDRGGDINVRINAADGQSKTFDCDAEAPSCSSFFADYTPENVSVTITKKESNIIKSYQVTYHNERPNGDDCPPVCKQGHIDVML